MLKVNTVLVPALLFSSLLLMDYILGNGLLRLLTRSFSKMIHYLNDLVKEETMIMMAESERPMNIPVLISEVIFLAVITTLLHRYSVLKTRNRIDYLLQESKYGLRLMNLFLDEWRHRRLRSVRNNEYLDDEPQPLTPLKLEIPILHMAIIDTRGSMRGQLERGDAGDSINISDSTLLSVTSLIDEDYESIMNTMNDDQTADETRNVDNIRYLWNVLEEDGDDLL